MQTQAVLDREGVRYWTRLELWPALGAPAKCGSNRQIIPPILESDVRILPHSIQIPAPVVMAVPAHQSCAS